MYTTALRTPFFLMEDVYFTGLVLPQINDKQMRYIDVDSVTRNYVRSKELDTCHIFFEPKESLKYHYIEVFKNRYTID